MNIREALYRLIGKRAPDGPTGSGLLSPGQCPHESEFLDYSEGRLENKRRAQLEKHFVSCEDCREFLAIYAQLSEDRSQIVTPLEPLSEETVKNQTDMILTLIKEDEASNRLQRRYAEKPSPGPTLFYARLATAAVAVLAVSATIYFFVLKPPQDEAMQSLVLAIKNERRIEPRVSGNLAWSRYSNVRGEEDNDRLALERAIDKLEPEGGGSEPDSSRLTRARIYLASGERDQAEQALKILRELAAKGYRTAAALNDTGVAMFQLGNYRESIPLFTEALEMDSSFEEALFNRALASYRAGLNEDAMRDWTEFIRKSSDEKWKDEARYHLNRLSRSSLP